MNEERRSPMNSFSRPTHEVSEESQLFLFARFHERHRP